MGLNVYLGPLVQVDGATSISTILLADVDVGVFRLTNMYQPLEQSTRTNIRRAPSLVNPSCSKFDFSPPLTVAVAAALPVATLSSCTSSFFYSSLELFVHEDTSPAAFFRRSKPCLAGMLCVPCNYSPYASQHVLRSVRASPYISGQ